MSDRFDPVKDAINLDRHGLPLMFGDTVMQDVDHLTIPSIRLRDGGKRFKAVGMVAGKLYTAVFTWRDDLPRFISVRRSNQGEEQVYESGL